MQSRGSMRITPTGARVTPAARFGSVAAVLAILVAALGPFATVRAVEPGNEHFARTWARPDMPVAEGQASRTWIWGPEASTGVMVEDYAEAPGGQREVQYFDKSRMEITDPNADQDSPWYVTNGLLVVEMVTGRVQVGHDAFIERSPAHLPIAGDPDDAGGPTYATFAGLMDAQPLPAGETVTRLVDRDGNISSDPDVEALGVTSAIVDGVTGHAIAEPFWSFMNSTGTVYEDGQYLAARLFENAYFATGRPITEPYGARVKVAGTQRLVVLQCFERRCLTYTPDNPEGWQVEAGNVGQHYYRWRYEGGPDHAGSLVINEVLFWPDTGEEQWVEIYNPLADDVNLDGWTLTNGEQTKTAVLPEIVMPGDSYLVVHFGPGMNDLDLSDGRGDYYTGQVTPLFAEDEDEVALYRGTPDSATIVDFLAWSYEAVYEGKAAHDQAVAAGTWTDNAYFDAQRRDGTNFAHPVMQGETIGRDRDSTDTNSPEDWAELGGEDALGETPRAENFHPTIPEPEPEPPPKEKAAWTVMAFMDGRDKGIRGAILNEINKMERSGSNSDVNIVVQYAEGADDDLQAARWYLEPDNDMAAIRSPGRRLGPGDAKNPGDPAALSEFITWAKAQYPADRYAIVLAGHGQGWKGTMLAGAGRDFLTMSELSDGLSALGQKFEVVEFESCLMAQVEVGYQISANARMMVGSEEVMWGVLPWTQFLDELKANKDWSAGEYADRKAELNAAGHSDVNQSKAIRQFYTMASIDLQGLTDTLVPAIEPFAVALRADVEDYKTHEDTGDNGQILIKHGAQERAEDYTDTNFKDLSHFAELVQGLPLSAANPAGAVVTALAKGGPVVRWEAHGGLNANSHGLSIYFPHDLLLPDGKITGPQAIFPNGPANSLRVDSFDDPLYDPAIGDTHLYKRDSSILIPRLANEDHAMEDDAGFRFPNSSTWDEFLHRYYKPVADACIRYQGDCVEEVEVAPGTELTLSATGSSDSDGYEDRTPGGTGDDVPAHYYWDFDVATDNDDAPMPAYQEDVPYYECDGEDCDRDTVDDADDDLDDAGVTVQYVCEEPGTRVIRLMVWDEHNDQIRERNEKRAHNEGRHWLHFNVDDDRVTVRCGSSGTPAQPKKEADRELVQPGEYITYTITVPASAALEGPSEGTIVDPINAAFFIGMQDPVLSEITCNSGECFYDPMENNVVWFGTFDPGETVIVNFSILVPEGLLPDEYPEEYQNCVHGFDGYQEFSGVCTSTQVVLPEE